jgi:hypothetical protein
MDMSNILIQNNLLYLVPMIVALSIVLFTMLFSQRMKHEKNFENESANFLHGLSYLKPFVWFINPDENDPKVRKMQVLLNKAGLHTKLNYRSFISLQLLLLMAMVFVYGLLFISLEAWVFLFGFLFNLPIDTTPQAIGNTRMLLAVVLLFGMLVPQMVIRMRAKKNDFMFTQDLPLVQLSLILMLRARRPISDIFFELSRTENRYREIFETGYRIFIRDKREAYEYLHRQFEGTGFEDAIQVLEQMGEFSKDESITVLENGLQQLIRSGQENKRGKALVGNLVSQFSLMLPFGGVLLLGAVPVAVYALSMLSSGSVQP